MTPAPAVRAGVGEVKWGHADKSKGPASGKKEWEPEQYLDRLLVFP